MLPDVRTGAPEGAGTVVVGAGVELLGVLERRWKFVVLCALVVAGAALVFSLSQAKQYSASTSLLFRDPAFDQKLFGSSYLAPSEDPDREAATNFELVSLDAVAQRAARKLGGGLTPMALSEQVDVEAEGRSNVVSISTTHTSPRRAAAIANTFASEFIAFRREADRNKLRQARALVGRQLRGLPSAQRQGPEGEALRSRAQELEVLASLQTGNAEVVEVATPPRSASSPDLIRNTLLGLLFGLIIGVGLALLRERFDTRFRQVKDAEDLLRSPVLAEIPLSPKLAIPGVFPDPADAEAFRMLRTNLRYFNVDREVRSVLVTSATSGEGKSTVAWNLAGAAAVSGDRALLIEGDLRRPVFPERFEDPVRYGLAHVLAGVVDFETAVVHGPQVQGALDRGGSKGDGTVRLTNMDVLVAGAAPPNAQYLLESDRMRELLADVEAGYDLVVIDTPPTLLVSDAIPLLGQVSGVILVVNLLESKREKVRELRDQLENLAAPVLGIVINSSRRPRGGYGYDYPPSPRDREAATN